MKIFLKNIQKNDHELKKIMIIELLNEMICMSDEQSNYIIFSSSTENVNLRRL